MINKLRKWNYEKRDYEFLDIPADWNVSCYSPDMEEVITCPHCGKPFKYGDGYTSLEIHTPNGFGYMVCDKCYNEEMIRRREYDQ